MNVNELTTTPVTPSEGAADPQTGVGTASEPTYVTVTQVRLCDKSLQAMSAVELDAYIKDRAVRCQRHVDGFKRRATELYLALLEMEGRYNKQQGARSDLHKLPAQTWTEYVEASGVDPATYRKWKSRQNQTLKLLGGVVAPDGTGSGNGRGSSRHTTNPATAAVNQAAKDLADAKAKLGRAAEDGSEQAKTIIAGYEKAHEDAVAAATPAAPDTAAPKGTLQVAWLRQIINQHHDNRLKVVPLHLREANALVDKLHRHHSPLRVAKFSIGVALGDKLIGAAICMRPACRSLDDGRTLEVARVAVESPIDKTDPRRNACSFLYGACARIAREMGFHKIQSYLLNSEPGESVRGAGWVLEKIGCGGSKQGERKGRPNGHTITPVTLMKKQRWGKILNTQTDEKAASSVTPTVESQKKPVASLRVLPSPMPCGGCKDMHFGIAEMAKADPAMSDEELAAKSGCDVTIVRQAKTRYIDWNKESA